MSIIYDENSGELREFGTLNASTAIETGYGPAILGTLCGADPYFDRTIGDLKATDLITVYKYDSDEIHTVAFSLYSYITDYLDEIPEFNLIVELIRLVYQDIKSVGFAFDTLADPSSAPEIFLPKLSYLLKYKYKYMVSSAVNRDIIKRLIWLYERKGTDQDILDHADYGDNPYWVKSTMFMPDGIPNDRVATITYPINNIFRHDISKYSGTDKFQDSTRYRDGVLIIKLDHYSAKVREALKQVIPAGLKVYFDVSTEGSGSTGGLGPQPGEEGYYPGVIYDPSAALKILEGYVLNYNLNLPAREIHTDPFDGPRIYKHIFSGRQILFIDQELEFTGVACTIPFYIDGYFGDLTAQYVPEKILGYEFSPIALANSVDKIRTSARIALTANTSDLDYSRFLRILAIADQVLQDVRPSKTGLNIRPDQRWVDYSTYRSFQAQVNKVRGEYQSYETQAKVDLEGNYLRSDIRDFLDSSRVGLNPNPTFTDQLSNDFIFDQSTLSGNKVEDSEEIKPPEPEPPVLSLQNLEDLLSNADDLLTSSVISKDGYDIDLTTKWVTQDAYNKFDRILEEVDKDLSLMKESTAGYFQSDVEYLENKVLDAITEFLAEQKYGYKSNKIEGVHGLSVDFEFSGSSKFSGEEVFPILDTAYLDRLLEDCHNLIEMVHVSDQGFDVDPHDKWTDPDSYFDFMNEVNEITDLEESAKYQSDIDSLITRTLKAIQGLLNSCQKGLQWPRTKTKYQFSVNRVFSTSRSLFSGIQVRFPEPEPENPPVNPDLNDSHLKELLEFANELLYETAVSVDGTDVDTEDYWVTERDAEFLRQAIKDARAGRETAENQYDIFDLELKLLDEIENFRFRRKKGLLDRVDHTLGAYYESQLLKLGLNQLKALGEYKASDYYYTHYPNQIKDLSLISNSFARQQKQLLFSPNTDNPIHPINYESIDIEVHRRHRSAPRFSQNAIFSGNYNYGGEPNKTVTLGAVEDVLPQDTYYPISAVESLFVYQDVNDTRCMDPYDHTGKHTAINGYYKKIEDLVPTDLVDINGVATRFGLLTRAEINEYQLNGMLKWARSNDRYLDSYVTPAEVVIEKISES